MVADMAWVWCRESGVRNLKKQLEKIYRKVALQLVKRGAIAAGGQKAKEPDQAAGGSATVDGAQLAPCG